MESLRALRSSYFSSSYSTLGAFDERWSFYGNFSNVMIPLRSRMREVTFSFLDYSVTEPFAFIVFLS